MAKTGQKGSLGGNMKAKGFTLIEVMIVLVIIGLVVVMIMNAFGYANSKNDIQYGFNGVTESRCIEGYKFIVDQQGNARQILDEFGKGARCDAI